jgi:ectoine hydroxylase-related dioxygenase (phytanoyl-CoA dioxygenase family)
MLKNVFTPEQLELISNGVEKNMASPSEYASENAVEEGEGRFFDDYCNWERINEFKRIVFDSKVGKIAALAMKSRTAQFFHDHVLVKEPFTKKLTPWHADMPYYFVDGTQTVSMWIPLEPVDKNTTLKFIAGSHKWQKMIRPVSWADDTDFYDSTNNFNNVNINNDTEYEPVPPNNLMFDVTTNTHNYKLMSWSMDPGDVVLFHFKTAHGAKGNLNNKRRRALSLRFVGDDVVFKTRPGKTSPPFPGHNMRDGQQLRLDWFPIIYDEEKEEKKKVSNL